MPMPMRLPALLLQRRLLLLPVLVPVRLPALLMVLLPGLAGTVADSGGGGGGGGGSGRGGAWAGPGAQAVPARITRAYVGARRLTGAGPPRIWSGSAAGREVCYTLPAGEEVGQGRARGGGQGRLGVWASMYSHVIHAERDEAMQGGGRAGFWTEIYSHMYRTCLQGMRQRRGRAEGSGHK